jgi:hypothetical protein
MNAASNWNLEGQIHLPLVLFTKAELTLGGGEKLPVRTRVKVDRPADPGGQPGRITVAEGDLKGLSGEVAAADWKLVQPRWRTLAERFGVTTRVDQGPDAARDPDPDTDDEGASEASDVTGSSDSESDDETGAEGSADAT